MQTIIYLHAFLGSLALISGGMALISKKGSKFHKRSGSIFFYSMLLSILISFFIALSPTHYNPFLFAIGIFSMYLIISGYRGLKYRKANFNINIDKSLAVIIIFSGLLMIFLPIYLKGSLNIILFVFGLGSILFGLQDFINFNNPNQKYKQLGMIQHIGRMTGGYIASISAFCVVNNILPGLWNWFTPSIIGTIYIVYSIRNYKKKALK